MKIISKKEYQKLNKLEIKLNKIKKIILAVRLAKINSSECIELIDKELRGEGK